MKRVSFVFTVFLMVMLFLPLYRSEVKAQESEIGYELLDGNKILRIWNKYDSYYFNVSSGIQFSNHYQEWWSHNVMGIGYRDVEDVWHVIYWTDMLSGFNKDVETDNATFVNATLWKDLSYYTYDFRLAIRYHLKLNDAKLTVQPYIKNLGIDIPYNLGFAWRLKTIKISDTAENDLFSVSWNINENLTDGESYFLNETLDKTYSGSNNVTGYNIRDTVENQVLELDWLRKIQNRTKLLVKSTTEYNAPVTLFVNVGTLASGQEKTTLFFWKDADLIDSYNESNQNANRIMKDNHPTAGAFFSAHGQCFQCTGGNYKITSAKFYLYKSGSPTGNAHAVLYAMTGTFGTDGEPTGSALATSDDFDVSTISGWPNALETFTFSGAEQYEMTEDEYYVIVYENPSSGIDSSNWVVSGRDSDSPTHGGNEVTWTAGDWNPRSTDDTIFYVYGETAGLQEYSEEFTETITVTDSLESWKALMFTETATVTLTSQLYRWGETRFYQTETVTVSTEHYKWIELLQTFSNIITVTSTSAFTKELLVEFDEMTTTETITATATLIIWKAKQVLFQETATVTSQFNKWKELLRFFTETLQPSDADQVLREKQFIFQQIVTITDTAVILKEVLVTFIEYWETIYIIPKMAPISIVVPTEIEDVYALAAIAFIFSVVGLVAFAMIMTKKD